VLTLPTIMLLERYPENNPIEALFRDRSQDGNVQRALDMIHNSSILTDCYAVVRGYCERATHSLDILPDCPARRSLQELSDYIWERTH
jgi:octaprenyl-diphosphate synthase